MVRGALKLAGAADFRFCSVDDRLEYAMSECTSQEPNATVLNQRSIFLLS